MDRDYQRELVDEIRNLWSVRHPTTAWSDPLTAAYTDPLTIIRELRREDEEMTKTEAWYGVEFSRKGEDDWRAMGNEHNTLEEARARMDRYIQAMTTILMPFRPGKAALPHQTDYRIVRKTVIKEPRC
jgi:hypothetical protein